LINQFARLLIAAVLTTAVACSQPVSPQPLFGGGGGELIALSHTYDAGTIYWPTADPFRLDKVADGITPGGYYYAANNFFTSEHGGTHLDAPIHFAQNHWAGAQTPLDRLHSSAIVVDVTAKADQSADYQVAVADLQQWEQQHGAIPANSILLLR